MTYQPNLVTDSGVNPSLHTNCYHQIVYCSLNLSIKSPTPYGRLIWDYNKYLLNKFTGKIINWYQFSIKLLLIYSQSLYQIGYLYVMTGIYLGLTTKMEWKNGKTNSIKVMLTMREQKMTSHCNK